MKFFKLAVSAGILLCLFSLSVFAQKMKVEDVITKHLESIGTAEKRQAAKSYLAVGDATVKYIAPKGQNLLGRIVIASTGEKNFLGLNLNSNNYPQEKFSFDGEKSKVAYTRLGARSVLGNFVLTNNQLLEQSLLGGTLSTSWALLDLQKKNPKLSFDGTKKIDGKETYSISYSVKNGGDIDITLYFDKTTFRHIRSEYKRTSSAGIGTNPDQSGGFSESRFKITEDFSDFKEVGGLTLPHDYKILYTVSGQNGTTEIEWDFKFTDFVFNQVFPDSTFDAEAN